MTACIASGLAIFGAYAMTVGGFFSQLPWPNTILWGITGIYGLRAAIPFILAPFMASMRTPFMLWSSVVCAVFALAHYGLKPSDVVEELARREGLSGLEEKALRKAQHRELTGD